MIFTNTRYLFSLSKKYFDKPTDREVSPLPGAASQIENLRRSSFVFGEITESAGFCTFGRPLPFLRRETGFPDVKIAPSQTYKPSGTMKVRKSLCSLFCVFLTACANTRYLFVPQPNQAGM